MILPFVPISSLWDQSAIEKREHFSQVPVKIRSRERTTGTLAAHLLDEALSRNLVYRLAYNDDIVAFKMGRRQGARRAHI